MFVVILVSYGKFLSVNIIYIYTQYSIMSYKKPYSTKASDSDYISDRASDEYSGYSAQKLPSHLAEYLRNRIVQYLTQSDDLSAEIQRSS